MANFKALDWVETFTVGGPTNRAVLDKIAHKVDDKFELYRSAPSIARLCELSPKPMRRALAALEEQGIITVIRRIRSNGSEANPLTLLNHPAAPHLNGVPVVLDYQGSFLYPFDPDGLREAGIAWVSANVEGRVHPKHQVGEGVVAETRGGGRRDQGVVVSQTTHGVTPETTLKSLPKEHPTTKAADAARDGGGGFEGTEKAKGSVTEAHRVLVAVQEQVPGFNITPRAVRAVSEQIEAGHPTEVITRALLSLDGFSNRASGVGTNVGRLGDLIADLGRENGTQGQRLVPEIEWCGECEEPGYRMVTNAEGRTARCPRCNPLHPNKANA